MCAVDTAALCFYLPWFSVFILFFIEINLSFLFLRLNVPWGWHFPSSAPFIWAVLRKGDMRGTFYSFSSYWNYINEARFWEKSISMNLCCLFGDPRHVCLRCALRALRPEGGWESTVCRVGHALLLRTFIKTKKKTLVCGHGQSHVSGKEAGLGPLGVAIPGVPQRPAQLLCRVGAAVPTGST